jgi:hypothetical protein
MNDWLVVTLTLAALTLLLAPMIFVWACVLWTVVWPIFFGRRD